MLPIAASSRLTLEHLAVTCSLRSRTFSTTRTGSLAATGQQCTTRATHEPQTNTSPTKHSPPQPQSNHKTHYLITLHRSPANLPETVARTCEALGLPRRLSSSIVPITQVSSGQVLAIKELVGVRAITLDQVVSAQWTQRKGAGNQGSGLRSNGNPRGIIRVGSERARGDERGYRILK
ncbi:BZ3500_MvSof-1268-A1-R1_Chr3-2g06279 [Microbotryum saponariae]|uniref:BZ3500_MvSof-1268-A1-R1_Chr3-2g06279 protein n=1 Tax=Microbotryum saponariae TaxID=289078 RepID=A0A2X0LGK7_9BASI|nr:BZ3500_MvSof-1268-A1-R1_Chr3-2g06279 [Microbotryum saponariae]SDA04250.1 BZ3501_MvSof-1269-A2-R1_Chr3-2g05970 [Microbotryum saponariae]